MSKFFGLVPRTRAVRILAFVAIFLLMCLAAFLRQDSLFGYSGTSAEPAPERPAPATGRVIDTSDLEKRIIGYAGKVPVQIFITDGRIDSVRHLPNTETPGFFQKLIDAGLPHAWDGKTLAEAAAMQVDAVSGATFSSEAYIENVRQGAARALDIQAAEASEARSTLVKLIVALLVILTGAIVPLFTNNRSYRLVQQVLNVAVLGFWAGTFIDYAMMLNFFANGLTLTLASAVTVLLLVVGLVYPVFGRTAHYCSWVCPLGAAQDLAGRIWHRKLHLPQRILHGLVIFRRVLWAVLMVLLLAGWGASWVDYELFAAFIVKSASWSMLTVGVAVILLSIIIPRPYCRFICPTGTLLRTE